MVQARSFCRASAIYNIFFLLPPALCHMEMSWPYPLRSKYNPANSYSNIDYSMTSPLEADGSNFPCKGYQNDRPTQPTISYTAGQTYNMTLAGSAMHTGGSCQLSLSTDNGATFRVIKSMIGGCPLASTYDFTIPSYAPSGVALLAWTWENLEGNREFYMNCAEVNIASGSMRRRKRQSYTSFEQLPYIWKANLRGVNNCTTSEQQNVVYPNAGPDVIYGGGLDSASPTTPGDCDWPLPYGRTYMDLGDTSPSQPSYQAGSVPIETSAASTSTAEVQPGSMYAISSINSPYLMSMDSNPNLRQAAALSESFSTTTITLDCPDTMYTTITPTRDAVTVTITPTPTYYTTIANPSACTGTSASCPCARNYQCHELSPCTWACNAYSTPTTVVRSSKKPTMSVSYTRSYTSRSTRYVTTTHTVTPTRSPTPRNPPHNHPPYASGNLARYLPCVPGTFICLDGNTWDTCAQDADGSWSYQYPRDVSAGMQCVTFLSPYSGNTNQYRQQGSTPSGYHRDDRIVRARPYGDCSHDGSIRCWDNGQTFQVCDQGGWVSMGSVAAGTTCRNGQIVASGG